MSEYMSDQSDVSQMFRWINVCRLRKEVRLEELRFGVWGPNAMVAETVQDMPFPMKEIAGSPLVRRLRLPGRRSVMRAKRVAERVLIVELSLGERSTRSAKTRRHAEG